jgi:Cytochrome c
MMRKGRMLSLGLTLGPVVVALVAAAAHADKDDHSHPRGTPAHGHPKAPVHITMEELHKHGGVPPGWRLAVPPGNPGTGRSVFAKLECYQCHEVKGEAFPSVPSGSDHAGPALTGMGSHHPPEYFLEAILNPNAVIVTGPGYTGEDGLSIMPDYRESLSVAELIDLVAYMQSLKGERGHPPEGGSGQPPPHSHGGRPKSH